mgnify:CR=1 FL=1
MSNKHLSRSPKTLLIKRGSQWIEASGKWYYEENRGIEIYGLDGTTLITWKQIRAALKRKDKQEGV